MNRVGFMLGVLLASGCMPPSVRAVDEWLDAFEAGDTESMVLWSHDADRPLVRKAMAERQADPTGLHSLALPPTPQSHYIEAIASKSDDGRRHVVATELTVKNPLPFSSRRMGQELEGVPETRKLSKRFLSVQVAPGDWRVKLDLPRTLERARFAERFEEALSDRDRSSAESMLRSVPPPPDEADALQKKDRLQASLRDRMLEVFGETSTTSTAAAERKDR